MCPLVPFFSGKCGHFLIQTGNIIITFILIMHEFNRRNIFARDGNSCLYCGKKFLTPELSLDPVMPRARGGGATWTNIVCACTECNKKKGGRTPREAGLR